jgi:tRNA dimethylallyltransferase
VADIYGRGRPVLVTGGSGFYLKSFFAPVADAVAVPPMVRVRVRSMDAVLALEQLRALNPSGLGALDTANPRRVTRALERCLASGRTLAELAAEFARQSPPFAGWEVKLVRLDRPADELKRRIELRVSAMLAAGLVEEVRGLLAQGLKDNPSAVQAIGYREVIAMLEGRLSAAEMAAEIAKNTRALVKKQRTWFRTQLPAHNVVAAEPVDLSALF